MEHKRLSGIIKLYMMVLKFSDVLIFKNCALLIFLYLYKKINLKIIEYVISFTHYKIPYYQK